MENTTKRGKKKEDKGEFVMEEKKDFKPFISADHIMPEFTITSVILGILLAVIFGAANAYLGLRVGMTVSASIPAAVISMGVIRMILKKESILENNIVQTIGSAGESVAAGAIFTIPALFLWSSEWGDNPPSLIEISFVALVGGFLGILFMVPLRNALIVKEHENLPYPEGTACAEVLLAGEKGGSKAGTVFSGLGIAAVYKFLSDGIKLFSSEVHYEIKNYKSGAVGIDALPALLGVGYICGEKIAAYMLSGGILGWLVLIPLIKLFGGNALLFPGTVPIYEMDSWTVWSNYIKYIGAGAVAAGGIISLIKSLPLIGVTFMQTMRDYKNKAYVSGKSRTERNLSMKVIMLLILLTAIVMWLVPVIPVSFVGAIVIIIFGFFFASVSARLVGLVGSSNNPVSGMTISTLLFVSLFLKSSGNSGKEGMIAAIVIGSIICIIAAVSGDTSQDLKTGYILGATPKKQQIGEFIGIIASAIAIGGVLYLLNQAWGYGSVELPAPQATLMKMIVEGVMQENLPWTLVFAGVFIAIVIELLRIPVLPFAVGLYLPLHLSVGIMVGGMIRLYVSKMQINESEKKDRMENGILYSSGLIAGEGLIGILLAVLAIVPWRGKALGEVIDMSDRIDLGQIGTLFFFTVLIATFFVFINKKGSSQEDG